MNRWKKLAIVAAVMVAIWAAGTSVVLLILPETELIRNRIEQRLRESTGSNVNLGAIKVSLAFPSIIKLNVEGITVPNRQGKSFLSVDRLTLVPSLFSLLTREVSIETIAVIGLRGTIRRLPDGSLEDLAPPRSAVPESSSQAAPPGSDTPIGVQQAPASPAAQETRESPPGVPEKSSRVRWSVASIKIINARLDLLDRTIAPNDDPVLSLREINGSANHQKPGDSFSVNLTGSLGGEKARAGKVTLDGVITPSGDFTALEAAQLNLVVASLSLKPLDTYLPCWARMGEEFATGSVRSEVSMARGRPARASLKIEMKADAQEASQLNVSGDLVTTEDLSGLDNIRLSCETDGLPFRCFKSMLVPQIPLDPNRGTVKAGIKYEWARDKPWKVQGSMGLENAVPSGKLAKVASRVRVWAQGALDADQMIIEDLEVSGATKLVSISGTVSKPLSSDPTVDVKGEIDIKPQWITDLGVQMPKGLTVSGSTPLRGRIRGRAEDLWFDLSGDLTAADVSFVPFVEKAAGSRGSLYLKGKVSAPPSATNGRIGSEATLGMALAGARIRLRSDGPKLSGCSVRLDSRLLYSDTKAEIHDATLVLRKEAEAGDMISAKANLTDLQSRTPRIDGSATINLDRKLLELTGLEVHSSSAVAGSSHVKAKFTGTPEEMEWSLDAPLTHLDVAIGGSFRKAGGVPGDLHASGKWSGRNLSLANSRLSLPGLVATGKGTLRDSDGRMTGVTLEVTKCELKELAALFPSATGTGVSGPLEARFRIRQSESGIAQTGTVRLLGIDYRPPNAAWSVDKIKGTVDTSGNSATIPEISGRIAGTVNAGVKIKGNLSNITSLETCKGRLLVDVGRGRIDTQRLRNILDQAQVLVGTLLNPRTTHKAADLLEFQSLTCTVDIESTTARTDNLKLKGADLNVGAIGSLQLKSQELDAFAGIQTATTIPAAIGQIPAIQQVVKQHEGLLKATGLDKELKKLGIEVQEPAKEKAPEQPMTKTPVTVILKIRGPVAKPQVVPVLETSLKPLIANRLKALLN